MLFDDGVRPDPDDPPEMDESTTRPYFGRYPVLLGVTVIRSQPRRVAGSDAAGSGPASSAASQQSSLCTSTLIDGVGADCSEQLGAAAASPPPGDETVVAGLVEQVVGAPSAGGVAHLHPAEHAGRRRSASQLVGAGADTDVVQQRRPRHGSRSRSATATASSGSAGRRPRHVLERRRRMPWRPARSTSAATPAIVSAAIGEVRHHQQRPAPDGGRRVEQRLGSARRPPMRCTSTSWIDEPSAARRAAGPRPDRSPARVLGPRAAARRRRIRRRPRRRSVRTASESSIDPAARTSGTRHGTVRRSRPPSCAGSSP